MLPALSIAALGMIESLLCGASAGKMKNEKLNADRELMAQGIGNMLIPLFVGVPATAAIARTSVAIKAGGKTRLVSVFHSIVIFISMFFDDDVLNLFLHDLYQYHVLLYVNENYLKQIKKLKP